MGIENRGLSFQGATSTESLAGVRVYYGDSPSKIYIKFTTQSGTDWQKSFDVAADVCGVPRGLTGTGDSGYGAEKGFYSNFTASDYPPVQRADGLWQWAVPLDLGDIGDGDLLDVFGPWPFSSRKYDALRVGLRIKSNYVDGKTDGWGRAYSDVEESTLWVGWFPKLALSKAWYTSGAIGIEYAHPDWERRDDRFAVEVLHQDGSTLLSNDFSWGTVAAPGKLTVPMSELRRIPSSSDVSVQVRINASYRGSGQDFATFTGTVPMEDRSKCSKPALSASWEGNALRVSVADAGDRTPALTSALVKLKGGSWSFDQGTCAPGGSVLLKFPPLEKALTIQATGFGADSTQSDVVEVAVPAKKASCDVLDSIDGSVSLRFPHASSRKVSASRNRTELTIEGRSRPVSMYGEGGTASWKLEAGVISKPGTSGRQDADSFSALLDCGDCVWRSCDGKRRVVGIDGYDVSESYPWWASKVGLDVSEVDYD